MKKTLIFSVFVATFLFASCNKSEGGKNPPPPPPEEYDVYSLDIREQPFTNSIQSNTSRENFLNTVTPWFSNATDGAVTSLDPSGPVQLFYKQLENGDLIKCLLTSSSNEFAGDGSLKINFSRKLAKVKLYAAGQYSYDHTLTPICDGYNTLNIDNQPTWVVTPYDIYNKVSTVDEKMFVINKNSMQINGTGMQRAFLYKFDFYFVK